MSSRIWTGFQSLTLVYKGRCRYSRSIPLAIDRMVREGGKNAPCNAIGISSDCENELDSRPYARKTLCGFTYLTTFGPCSHLPVRIIKWPGRIRYKSMKGNHQ